ncbi:MAG TPA: bacillithiol biosynthesis deacetylase BshB1 [Candidatus Kapabacteria bacterium]|nr:bacillithiol biosynthesis deacetylase BshB1 [Candidatus Kapabacteria bacterium]
MTTIDILGIAAHPDDVELSSAGTLLTAKLAGKRTGILDLTHGELSTRGTPETRTRETAEATKILKLDVRDNVGLPDGNIEITQENVLKVIHHLRALRPSIVLSPHFSERHPDHEAAAELVHRAAFYAGLAKIETTGSDGKPQKPFRPLLVLHFMQTYLFEPKLVIDVSDVWEARMDAVHAYSSQFDRGKDGRKIASGKPETFLTQSGFYEWIEARARHFGMVIGAEFGEPFWCEGPVGLKDVFSVVTKKIA